MEGFANMVHRNAAPFDILLFEYDWTQSLEDSGEKLAKALLGIVHTGITLVGYSMGGLVSRLAASRSVPSLTTVITVATPNRGALSTAQLVPLGQSVLGGIRMISPMFHCQGVMDLTRADEILFQRRQEAGVDAAVKERRYASVPALYFHTRRQFSSRRTKMGSVSRLLEVLPLTKLRRPHDGIVTEDSNNLVSRTNADWDEIDFAEYDGRSPARCHAVHIDARERDHSTILDSESDSCVGGEVGDVARLARSGRSRCSFVVCRLAFA